MAQLWSFESRARKKSFRVLKCSQQEDCNHSYSRQNLQIIREKNPSIGLRFSVNSTAARDTLQEGASNRW